MLQRTQATGKSSNFFAKSSSRAILESSGSEKSIDSEDASISNTSFGHVLIDTIKYLTETLMKTSERVEELQRDLLVAQVQNVQFAMQEK